MKIESIEAFAIDNPAHEELRRQHLLGAEALDRRDAPQEPATAFVSEIYNGDNREHAPAIARSSRSWRRG